MTLVDQSQEPVAHPYLSAVIVTSLQTCSAEQQLTDRLEDEVKRQVGMCNRL